MMQKLLYLFEKSILNMQSSELKSSVCPQCRTSMAAEFDFCSYCGQKRIKTNESVTGLVNSFLGDYFAFDSKLMSSIKPLIGRPGFLTTEYIESKRVHYISPLRLYIFISILFFLILNWGSGDSVPGNAGESKDVWDDFFNNYMPKIFFFLVPLFAGLLKLMFRKTGVRYVFQLVGALHFHAFVFLVLSLFMLLSSVFAKMGMYQVNVVLLVILLLWFLVYLFISTKRITGIGGFKLVWKYLVLLILYSICVTLITIGVMGYFAMNI